MILSSASVFAANGDVYTNVDPAVLYKTGLQLGMDPSLGLPIGMNPDGYLYEYEGKLYKYTYIQGLYAKDPKNFTSKIDPKEAVQIVGELKVMDVKVQDDNSLAVIFSEDISKKTDKSNFKVFVDGVEKKIENVVIEGVKATLTIKELPTTENKGETGLVQVMNVKNVDLTKNLKSAEVKFTPPLLAELVLETSEPNGIVADGKSTMTITAKVVKTVNGKPELQDKLNGEVFFTTTKGQFAQGSVVLDKGVAKAQLISEYYSEDQWAHVSAVIKSVPDYRQYEGITSKFSVLFKGVTGSGGSEKMIRMLDANARQADRIMLIMSDTVTPEMLEKIRTAPLPFKIFKNGKNVHRMPFLVDGVYAVEDVIAEGNMLTLILDVDNYYDGKNVTPELDLKKLSLKTQAERDAMSGGYLRDFATHRVSIPKMIEGALFPLVDGKEFLFDDNNYPTVFDVDYDKSTGIIRVDFKEAVAEDHAEEIILKKDAKAPYESIDPKTGEKAKGILISPHFTINGMPLMMTQDKKKASEEEKEYARKNPVVLVNEVYVSKDDRRDHEGYRPGWNPKDERDTRRFVSIKLDIREPLRNKDSNVDLEIAMIGDWAGMTDARNVIQTQTISLKLQKNTDPLTWKVEMQSPEQYLIKFSHPIMSDEITGKGLATVQDIFKISKDGSTNLKYGLEKDDGEYVVSALGAPNAFMLTAEEEAEYKAKGEPLPEFRKDYYSSGTLLAATDVVEGEQNFLLELTKDWEVIYDTDKNETNYYSNGHSPHTISINHIMSMSGLELTKKSVSVDTPQDVKSPSVLHTRTVFEEGTNAVSVLVVMDEPSKALTADTRPTEGITESQEQTRSGIGVPPLALEFRNRDKNITILGTAKGLYEDDYAFYITPIDGKTLSVGKWELAIRSISDDIGNTIKTVKHELEIKEAEKPKPVDVEPEVLWVAFDNADHGTEGDNVHDRIYVKFNMPMKGWDYDSVTRTQNWLLNGQTLDKESKIEFGIKSRDGSKVYTHESMMIGDKTKDNIQHMDGITISMPPEQFKGSASDPIDFACTLTFSNFFKARDTGKPLMQPMLRDGSTSWKVPLEDSLFNNDKSVPKALSEAEDMNLKFESFFANKRFKEVASYEDFMMYFKKLMDLKKKYGFDEKTGLYAEEENYTPSTWKMFMAAIKDVEEKLGNWFSTKDDLKAIWTAFEASNPESLLVERASKANLKKLEDKILELEGKYKEADYTADSWKAFKKALDDAKKALKDPETTDDIVNEQIQNLDNAVKALKKKPASKEKFDELDVAIQLAKLKVEADYTPESWAPFAAALKKAEEVYANKMSNEDEVNQAIKNLKEAQANLEKKPDETPSAEDLKALDDAITAAEALDESLYENDANMTAFKQALTDAKAVKADASKTKKQVQDATKALTDAQKNLTKKVEKATAAEIQALKDEITASDAVLAKLDDYEDEASKKDDFKNALKDAKDFVAATADADMLKADVLAKTNTLKNARLALKLKGGAGTVVFELGKSGEDDNGWDPSLNKFVVNLLRTASSPKTAVKTVSYNGVALDPAKAEWIMDGDNIMAIIDDATLALKDAQDLIPMLEVVMMDDTKADIVKKGSAPPPSTIVLEVDVKNLMFNSTQIIFDPIAGKTVQSATFDGVVIPKEHIGKKDGRDRVILKVAIFPAAGTYTKEDIETKLEIVFNTGEKAVITVKSITNK